MKKEELSCTALLLSVRSNPSFFIFILHLIYERTSNKNTGSWYLVKTEDGRTIECKIKGNFRLKVFGVPIPLL